jgi:hypothetical protein
VEPIDFSFKMVPCKFSLNLSLCGLQSSSKGSHVGPICGSHSNRIALFHWTLDPGPSSKVALREVFACLDVTTLYPSQTLGPSTWLVVPLEILQHGGVQGRESYVLGNQ